DRTINIVKNTDIEEIIRLQDWKPRRVCCTTSGELLIIMEDNEKHSKIVRYFGSTEKQSIQFDDEGNALFSTSGSAKYSITLVIDPRTSAQDLVPCDLSETAIEQVHCDTCLVNLCRACVGDHISTDETKDHRVEAYNLAKQGEESHKQIDQLVKKLNKAKALHLQTLQRHLDEIGMKIVNIKDDIDSLAKAADSNDISTPFSVRSKVDRYKKLPQQPVLPVPKFTPGTILIQGGELCELFGALSSIFFQSGDDASGYSGNTASRYTESVVLYFPGSLISDYPTNPSVGYPGNVASSFPGYVASSFLGNVASSFTGNVASSFSGNVALDFPGNGALGDSRNIILDYFRNPTVGFPRNVASVASDYIRDIALNYPRTSNYPGNVTCLGNEMTWLSVNSDIITLYRFNHGLQVKTIKTKPGNNPGDIVVTNSGDLVYTDHRDGSVNIVNNWGIKEMIILQYWRSHGVCSISSRDLLVIIESNENKQARVVRCSTSKEIQSIQFDDENKPLYSSSASDKYICENRNHDICLADCGAKAVIVVSQAGKLKFRYNGQTPILRNKQLIPKGNTTDSQGNILTCDDNNKCVHVINEDGDIIRYISCESLYILCGLCTDTDDNLFLIGYEHISSKCT
ncbi:uncharacterized protein LOC134254706, partial [Saccostrea cucullata]|uniref:uncharacterized protein LOC134254706 n=1 Tax=Saccostrea cuccullata TaxID=36930 RepID=UPI002ED1A4D6